MRVTNPGHQPRRPVGGIIGTTSAGFCPRMLWRSMNPALPPPEPLACLTRGPDCCATSVAVDVRRVA